MSINHKKLKQEELWRLAAIQGGRNIEIPPPVGDNEEYITVLIEFMEESAAQFRFLEAECARLKVEELKGLINHSKASELKDKHENEKEDIDKAHQEELEQFNVFWDEKLREFEHESEKMCQELQQRHNEENDMYKEELEQGLPSKSKDSQKLLELKARRD